MIQLRCDVLVIGSGPGGHSAAARAGELGLEVVIVDGGPLGGTCLNVGCIPSKCIIHAADEFVRTTDPGLKDLGIASAASSISLRSTVAWKDTVVERLRSGLATLLRSAHVTVVNGRATFVDGKTVTVDTSDGPVSISAAHVVIATGSSPSQLPHLPFVGRVISSTEALSLHEVPEELVIIGAGYIGLELGTAFRKLGSNVTIVEMEQRILPRYDEALTRPVAQRVSDLGIQVRLESRALALSATGDALVVEAGNDTSELAADHVLVTVGRSACLDGFGLESLELAMDGPHLEVDDQCRTSMSGVFAIGDVTGEPMLAHRATAQGEMVAEIIAGQRRAWDDRVVPEVCFTDPEIFSVGLSPDQAAEADIEHVAGRFNFAANGRALSLARPDGFVRVVAARNDRRVLGIQAVGQGVAELAAAGSLALEMDATVDDLVLTIHAHPTLSEAVREAAHAATMRLNRS